MAQRLAWITGLAGMVLSLALSPAVLAAATVTKSCTYVNGQCGWFTSTAASTGNSLALRQAFTFAVRAGNAVLVTFTGKAICAPGTAASTQELDLQSQIVVKAATSPNYTGPGGDRFRIAIAPHSAIDGERYFTIPFSAVRRFVYTTAGNQTVYFNASRMVMSAGISCSLEVASFTAVITP